MAETPTFQPFGGPTDVMESMYRAQDQRMSMMSKARAIQQQELTNKMLEAKQAEWEMMAPLRQKQTELQVAETGAQLYTANIALEEEKALANDWPSLMEKVKAAQVTPKDADGMPDYAATIPLWADVMAESSKYANTARGKQAWTMAKAAMDTARLLNADQIKEKIARLKAQNELKKTIVDGVLYDVDPTTGEMAEHKGAYPTPQQAASKVGAEEEARQKAKRDVEYLTKIEEAGDSASQDLVSVKSMSSMLKSKGASTGYGQSSINTFVSVLDRAGIPVDSEKLSNNQYIEQQMSLLKVRLAGSLMRGQGQITEKERDMLERATASVNWTPETNIRILDSMAKMFERAKQLNRIKLAMEQDGKSSAEIRMAIEQYKQENDFSFDLEEAQNRATEGSSGPKQITSKADFDALPSGAQFIFNGKVGTKK